MPDTAARRSARSVPGGHALEWFAQAIRLWKRAPLAFTGMALLAIVATVALKPVPGLGLVASHIVAPLLLCGMYYASLAADRNERPRFLHVFAAFLAPARAQVAVVAAAFVVTLAESALAWYVGGINPLATGADDATPSSIVIVLMVAASALLSLPFAFVPMAVLFDNEPPMRAFASSWEALVRNPRPMLALAAYAYALAMAGFATGGVGLVLALPWVCSATYLAWKDIFGVDEGKPSSPQR